jgi:hypothetical protein
MLDRVDSGLDREPQPGPTERVAHHFPSERVRLVDQDAHLVARERGIGRPVSRSRAGSARRGALDGVRPGADHRPHDRSHLVHAVRDAVGQVGIGGNPAAVSRWADRIADAAGRRDDLQAERQSRARDHAFLDRELEACVEAAGVPHGGVPHRERLLEHARSAQVCRTGRLVESPSFRERVAVGGEVIVCVDEPWQQRETR